MKYVRPCLLSLSLCVLATPFSAPSAYAQTLQTALCGNSLLDEGEQCDDGNAISGDGCSDTCQVEAGYSCTDPVAANVTNLVLDPGFEAGPFGGEWVESSTNFGTPVCDDDDCGYANGARSGAYWAWFGGIGGVVEEGWVSQVIGIPSTATELRFWIRVPDCNPPDDFFEVRVDETNTFTIFSDDSLCGGVYAEQSVDISEWADGADHTIKFYSATVSNDVEAFTSFFLDDVSLIHGPAEAVPSVCTVIGDDIFADGFEGT